MTNPSTRHYSLPLIAPAQAQKHVTHNEAIVGIDEIIDIVLVERGLNDPPALPSEGDRYSIGAAATGAWSGHANALAHFRDGTWVFLPLRPGLTVWVSSAALLAVWDGADWQDFTPGADNVNPAEFVGVNTTADATNRLAVKSDAVLFSHDDVTPGTGDIRFTANKLSESATASFLFQSNWQGRAELGLTGDDDFSLKTSPDGVNFNLAMTAERQTGIARFPNGVSDLGIGTIGGLRNLLINATGAVNQRGTTGALAAGEFGPDRWRAGAGGCTVSVTGGLWTLNGSLEQVIEDPGLAGLAVCVSVADPDGDLSVSVGSASGVIGAGSGRRWLRLDLAPGDSGNLTVTISAASSTSFHAPQVEAGLAATPFERRHAGLELALCQRYYYRFAPTIAGGTYLCMKQTTQQWRGMLPTPVPLRALPTVNYSYGANKSRIYIYSGANVDIDSVNVIGYVPTGVQLAYNTASDSGPSLAILFPFAGNSIDLSCEL